MTHSAVAEHEIMREAAPRASVPPQTDATPKPRSVEAEAPVVERVRNVGGRLMA